eukprot:GHVQ01029879.1.p1 GENE.GHVQ01029879.1~~GHVQ01029879.1.p1  ORF type:complete len:318 (+),score=25.28 GHVQ01029879.1:144-1097(+)
MSMCCVCVYLCVWVLVCLRVSVGVCLCLCVCMRLCVCLLGSCCCYSWCFLCSCCWCSLLFCLAGNGRGLCGCACVFVQCCCVCLHVFVTGVVSLCLFMCLCMCVFVPVYALGRVWVFIVVVCVSLLPDTIARRRTTMQLDTTGYKGTTVDPGSSGDHQAMTIAYGREPSGVNKAWELGGVTSTAIGFIAAGIIIIGGVALIYAIMRCWKYARSKKSRTTNGREIPPALLASALHSVVKARKGDGLRNLEKGDELINLEKEIKPLGLKRGLADDDIDEDLSQAALMPLVAEVVVKEMEDYRAMKMAEAAGHPSPDKES